MGKRKHAKPVANIDTHSPAGSAGAENLATAGETGTVSEMPADAVSAAPPAPQAQPAGDAAGTDQTQPVPQPAVAAGPQETETEGLTDGQAAQAPADGEQDSATQGPGLPPGEAGQPADSDSAAAGAAGAAGEPADLGGADGGLPSVEGNGVSDADGRGNADGLSAGDDTAAELNADDDDHVVETLRELARFDIAQLARGCAVGGQAFADGAFDINSQHVFTREEAEIMVGFVRDNPEAPLLAMYNHLRLAKRYPETAMNSGDLLALTLFHAAVTAALAFERTRADEKAASEAAAAPADGWPGEQAFKPQPGPFDPVGLSPTR